MNPERAFTAVWYRSRPSLAAFALWPLSVLFRTAVVVRRALYLSGILKSEKLAVPVVVIGNMTIGGVGKTPLARALARALAERGFRPGLVSRGYGGKAVGPRAVAADDDPREVGDEPPLLALERAPVFIGRDRAAAARALLKAHPGVNMIICDDGLQHYALARTMEIAAIDGGRRLGNGFMLPAGPLREPASRLASVDAVVSLVAEGAGISSRGGRETQMTHEALPWRNLKDAGRASNFSGLLPGELLAIAGIGNPQRFFDLIRKLGLDPECHVFPDHHFFRSEELAFPGARAILMTEKDAVKCRRYADERMWCLPIRARIDPALVALVEDRIRGRQTA